MGEIAIKKKVITKVLSCFVIIAILMSAMPVSVFAVPFFITNNATGVQPFVNTLSSTPNLLTGINQTIDSKEINSTNNIATALGEEIPGIEKGEVLFRGEFYTSWEDETWWWKEVYIDQVLYDPNNYLEDTPYIWVLKPRWSYPRMDWVSSGTLVEVYGQYVVGEKDEEIYYTEIRLCEPGEEWGSREYFLRDLTQEETCEFTGTITAVPKKPSVAGLYYVDLDAPPDSPEEDWDGDIYFSKFSNGPQIDNLVVGDKVIIRGSLYQCHSNGFVRAEIDLITSNHYLKKKDSEPTQFYIRPACHDVNGNHLDDVSYEFVDYPTYKGTCDYNEYLIAPGHGTYRVKFTKGDLEATVTLESHLKPFAGTVVTLRKKEGSIYATSTPSGANVYLDGSYKGTSPLTISNVPVGSHTVKYTKTGYKDCVKTVTVYANQQRNVHCYMEEEKFYIRPACQDVNGNHLDDVSYEFVDYPTYKGTCDYSGYLIAPGFGTYKVKFTKGDLEATVTLESHSKTFAGTVVTLRKKEGSIYATSTPSGANVYLDGSYKGTSPLTISNVPVGSYTAKYTKTGYKDCEKTVTVYANQQRNVHCDLVPISQTGSIYATSTPSGANVYLDGTYKGVSPITISNVPVGTHTVKFAKTGYKDCEKTVTVYANSQRNVHCDLEEESTIGELIEKLNEDPESVVNKKFATNGWVYFSTHEAWKGVEILNDVLVTIETKAIDPLPLPRPIKQFLEELFKYLSPANVWDYCFGIHSMGIMSISESDQRYNYFPLLHAYAKNDNLWPETGSVVYIEGTWEKRTILWKTIGYIFRVDNVATDKTYVTPEDLEDLEEGTNVKMMALIAKKHIQPDNTYKAFYGKDFEICLKLPEDINLQNLTFVEIQGELTSKAFTNVDGKKVLKCTVTVDNLRTILASKAHLESQIKNKETIIIECPINATITDQYGRIIADDGTNEIQDADMLIIDETKIFYLPADLRYSVDIDAYGSGTFNFTRVSPIGNDISITKFENIPVTSNTKASVEIEPGVTDYTMSMDYNGDGVTDEEKSPDVSETVEVTTPTTIVFEDDFGEPNLDSWIPFGSPSPRVLASAEGRTGVFDNNGDGWCNSGVVSKDTFSFPNGCTMESDMYLKVTNVAGCWNSPVIGLTRQNKPTGEGVCPSEDYPMGVIFGIEYDGDACWATPSEKRRHAYFIIGLYTEEGTWESVSWLNADDYTDAWHNFKIAVGSDRIVKFYVDNELIYTSKNKINKEILDGKKIFLGIRSSGSAGKAYHDYVKVYATTPSTSNIIYVPDDYSTIQQAVNAANSGDTIIVRDGTYIENVDVNKPHLTIRSENGAKATIVQAASSDDHIFEVTADYVNISGFTVEGATEEAGIYLHGVDHCIISDNNVLNNKEGIYLYSSNNNVITNNYVNSNDFGIWLIFSSFSNTIANNNASNNFLAISLTYSDNNMITKNNVSNNKYGIWHIHSNNSMITENIISNSDYDGFWLDFSNNNTITKNHILDNDNGIILNSTNNRIYRNNFINNANNVYPEYSVNIWNSSEKITYTYKGKTYKKYLGNYWSDYGGNDINGDGIGDTAYGINSDKDNYPLMQPWENYFEVDKSSLKMTITSDKEEYSPGDTVNITTAFEVHATPEEPIIITNPITVTFIAPDGSVVLQEDLGSTVHITLWGGKYSIGYSFKLSEDAPEGYYDVTASFSGGKYVKTAEDLFFVKAGEVPGDVTGDGRVDYNDLTEIIEYWGAVDTKYDVDRSGTVSYSDLMFTLDHWTASKPYGRATTTVKGPVTVPLGSSFRVQITTDGTVEAAHISVIFPSELNIESINVDPDVDFDFSTYQNGTDWIDVMVAEAPGLPTGYPEAPLLAEICFTATEEGTYTIDLSLVLNGEANDVEALTVEVEVEAESIDTTPPVVISVEQSNDSPEQGEDVTITAHVTDNIGVTSVTEKGGYWSATIPGQPTCTTLCISVTASDAAGNTATFWPHGKHWVDTIAPTISNIKVSPTYALPGDSINISAGVFYSSGIRWVRAFISKGGEDVGTIFMSDSDGDGVYTGTWQTMNFTESGTYNIDISATDTDGNEALAKGPEIEIA